MAFRINFDVDDETKVKIDDVMAATGISTKRQLFEAALDVLARVRGLVREQRVILAVKTSDLDSVLRSASRGALVVEQPPVSTSKWLIERSSDWRSTPWLKGTRVHVSDVMALLAADPELTADEIARDLKVPAEAISDCLTYARANKALIDAEEREAALRSAHQGDHAPPAR